MKRKTKKKKSIILRLFILGVSVYFIVTFAGLWSGLNEKINERDRLKEEYTAKVNDIEELRSLLSQESNRLIIEKAARERLGYSYAEEQVFIDISGS